VKRRPHINPELLARCAERGELAKDASSYRRHLQRCGFCAEAYVNSCLKTTVLRVEAPDSIWPSIESATMLSEASRAHGRLPVDFRLAFAFAGCLFGVLVLSAALFLFRHKPQGATLDVGQYLARLERTDIGPSKENLLSYFTEFGPYDRSAALQQTRFRSEVGNYHLVEGRISRSTNTVELVYDSDRDVFAVFVAPRTANLSFGNYHLLSVDLSGLHCRRVQCPRQDVYLLTTGTRQYVFIRRHNSFGNSSELFNTLIQEAR
jgi:hypothetical protein